MKSAAVGFDLWSLEDTVKFAILITFIRFFIYIYFIDLVGCKAFKHSIHHEYASVVNVGKFPQSHDLSWRHRVLHHNHHGLGWNGISHENYREKGIVKIVPFYTKAFQSTQIQKNGVS